MLQLVCHPAIQNLLIKSEVRLNGVTAKNNAALFSDFLPKTPQQIHAGLLEATKYRISHPSNYIYVASFFPKEKLFTFDTYGILSLAGTEFIRLPFPVDQFFITLEEKQQIEPSLSKSEWESFSIRAGRVLLKEKLSLLKHGGEFAFVNNATFALRIESQNCLAYPNRIVELRRLLLTVNSYIENKEISELVALSELCGFLPDSFLRDVYDFTCKLKQLSLNELKETIDCHLLIIEIDALNNLLSKMLNP